MYHRSESFEIRQRITSFFNANQCNCVQRLRCHVHSCFVGRFVTLFLSTRRGLLETDSVHLLTFIEIA